MKTETSKSSKFPYPVMRQTNVPIPDFFLDPTSKRPIFGGGWGTMCAPNGKIGYGISAYMCKIVVYKDGSGAWINNREFPREQLNPSLLEVLTNG